MTISICCLQTIDNAASVTSVCASNNGNPTDMGVPTNGATACSPVCKRHVAVTAIMHACV